MNLIPPQRQQLHQALLDAFRTRNLLAQMVSYQMGVRLDQITTDPSLEDNVFKLVDWVESQGRVTDLLGGAAAANPGNPYLADFITSLILPQDITFNVRYDLTNPTGAPPTHFTNPTQVPQQARLGLQYQITNKLSFRIPVWMGADLGRGDDYYPSPPEDADTALDQGVGLYFRTLQVIPTCPPGHYTLHAAVWYGHRTLGRRSRLGPVWRSPTQIEVV